VTNLYLCISQGSAATRLLYKAVKGVWQSVQNSIMAKLVSKFGP